MKKSMLSAVIAVTDAYRRFVLPSMLLVVIALIPVERADADFGAGIAHEDIVSQSPSSNVPRVVNGKVWAIAQWGDLIVVGGKFSQVRVAGGAILERSNIFAFKRASGEIDGRFAPSVNGTVLAIAVDPQDRGVFVGGQFGRVNGESRRGLAFLDREGIRVSRWAGRPNGAVFDLAVRGDQLYVGGKFSKLSGTLRNVFGTVNVSDGKVSSESSIVFADPRYSEFFGVLEIRRFEISPDGSKMVVLGNFQTVDGVTRDQVVVLDVGSSPDRVTNWSTTFFDEPCNSPIAIWPYFVRDVSISPDGNYFVVVTTGGIQPTENTYHPCDMAARLELNNSSNQSPTWVQWSGGDSILSVEVTGEAVYIGGHYRWLDNLGGRNEQAPGSIARGTLAALDPLSGAVFDWNPGRKPRGHGVLVMEASKDGLWIGHDAGFVNGTYSPRLTHFELPDESPARTTEPSRNVRVGAGKIGYEFNLSSGSYLLATRSLLFDRSAFGPGGTYDVNSVTIVEDVPTITQAYLDDIDVLFSGYIADFDWTLAELVLVESWVRAGGVVISANDDPGYDALAAHFGNRSVERAGTSNWTAQGDNPIVTGPFGSWSAIVGAGWTSYFDEVPGWTVVARDESSRATLVTRQLGNGLVIQSADEGIFREGFPGPNRTMAGNLFAMAFDAIK